MFVRNYRKASDITTRNGTPSRDFMVRMYDLKLGERKQKRGGEIAPERKKPDQGGGGERDDKSNETAMMSEEQEKTSITHAGTWSWTAENTIRGHLMRNKQRSPSFAEK